MLKIVLGGIISSISQIIRSSKGDGGAVSQVTPLTRQPTLEIPTWLWVKIGQPPKRNYHPITSPKLGCFMHQVTPPSSVLRPPFLPPWRLATWPTVALPRGKNRERWESRSGTPHDFPPSSYFRENPWKTRENPINP